MRQIFDDIVQRPILAQRYPHPSHQQQQQSPHYIISPAPSDRSPGIADMRSPPIVSPNHVGQLPPHQFQQFHHPQQQQPASLHPPTRVAPYVPVFYGHEPSQVASRCINDKLSRFRDTHNLYNYLGSPEICLAGCVFLVLEEGYPPQLNFQVDRSSLPAIIRFYGGDVEQQTPRGIPERVTHVLCRSVQPLAEFYQKMTLS